MDESTRKRIIELNDRGLSVYYIVKHLEEEIPLGIIQQTIEESAKEDFNSLFK